MPVSDLHADARISASGVFVPPAHGGGPQSAVEINLPLRMQFGGPLDGRLRAKRPLPVRLFKEQDAYIVHCAEIDQFGYGQDISDALDDFGRTVSEMYFYLFDQFNAGNLADAMARAFHVLEQFLEPRDTRSNAS